MRAAPTLGAVLACLFAVFGSCTSSSECCNVCPASQSATFQLTCDETDLKTVTVTGPCELPDGGSWFSVVNGAVFVDSQGAGVCHVALTFGTGFTFATDVSFETQSGGVCGGPQCKCPDFVVATSGPFAVHNPGTTCVEAGIDAAGTDAEAGPDADAGPSTCPSNASQDVPCGAASGMTCQGCRDNATFECTCAFADAGVTDAGAGPSWQCVDRVYECGR